MRVLFLYSNILKKIKIEEHFQTWIYIKVLFLYRRELFYLLWMINFINSIKILFWGDHIG